MPDLDVALRLRADASGLVGEVRRSKQELDRLGRSAQEAATRAGRGRRAWAAFGREMEATQRRATGLRLVMTALATGVAARVGASFLKAASDAEELRSQFDQVFRGLSSEAREWARVHAEAVGRSSLDIEQYLATLQDTFVPLGFAREQAFQFSRTLTQLGVDLASFKNAAEPETIDLLTSAIVGNHEAVRRFGIVITESTLKQELLNAGIEGGVQAATEQQKVLARLRIILRSTADAQGDAARTADQHANQVRALTGDWRDFQVTIGGALIPTAQTAIALLREALGTLEEEFDADGIGREIERTFRRTLLGAAAAADTLSEPFDVARAAIGELVSGFNELPPWVQEIGVLGAVLFGRRGRVLLAGVAGVSALADRLTPDVQTPQARARQLEEERARLRREITDRELSRSGLNPNDALDRNRLRVLQTEQSQLVAQLDATDREIERLRTAQRLDDDIRASARAHGATGAINLPADTALPPGLFGGSLLGRGSGGGDLVTRLEQLFDRIDAGEPGATPSPLSPPDITGVTSALTATQEREIGSFVRKMQKALEEIEEDHRDAIEAITDAEADLAGPYEAAVRAANKWRDETLKGLNETADGYDQLALRVENVYLERIANAAEEATERQGDAFERLEELVRASLKEMGVTAEAQLDFISTGIVGAARAGEDAFVQLATRGKANFSSFTDSIIADLARIAYRQAILGPIVNAIFGGGAVGATGSGPLGFFGFHGGGRVGGQASFIRYGVDPSIFNFAPRYHGGGVVGLRPGERPIIARDGETIRTEEQEAALHRPSVLRIVLESRDQDGATTEQEIDFDLDSAIEQSVTANIAQGGGIGRAVAAIAGRAL